MNASTMVNLLKERLGTDWKHYLSKKVEINWSSIYWDNASDNQLAETFSNFSKSSNSISTKENKFFCTGQKDQTQTSSLHKRLEARLAGGHRKALAT